MRGQLKQQSLSISWHFMRYDVDNHLARFLSDLILWMSV